MDSFGCNSNSNSIEIDAEITENCLICADEFDFSARFSEASQPMSTAEELFCNGQIRPLVPMMSKLWCPSGPVSNQVVDSIAPRSLVISTTVQTANYGLPTPSGSPAAATPTQLPAASSAKNKPKSSTPHYSLANYNGTRIFNSTPQRLINHARCANQNLITEQNTRRLGHNYGAGRSSNLHRRHRSLSPSRVFHMDDVDSCSECRQSFETTKSDNDAIAYRAKSKHFTLRDFLHSDDSVDDQKLYISNQKSFYNQKASQIQAWLQKLHTDVSKLPSPHAFPKRERIATLSESDRLSQFGKKTQHRLQRPHRHVNNTHISSKLRCNQDHQDRARRVTKSESMPRLSADYNSKQNTSRLANNVIKDANFTSVNIGLDNRSPSDLSKSPHLQHYITNQHRVKYNCDRMKKRTSLPYKHGGLLSCLGIHTFGSKP